MSGKLVEIDARGLHKSMRTLERIRGKALPHAARDILNELAFEGRKEWQQRMGKSMTLRNQYTTRSVAVDKARGVNLREMQSRLGSLQPYMATQEDGGTVTSKGKHGVTIPTPTASGEGMSANPRKRLVRRANWLSAIRLGSRPGNSAKQRNAIAISKAKRDGTKTAFLELGKRKGIVRIMGGKKGKLRMVWDMSKKSLSIPRNPTLEPTMQAILKRGPSIAEKHAMAQIRRALR